MNTSPTAILRHLRELQPDRNLEDHEARSVAEKQAMRLLQILGQTGPAVDVSLIAELPRIEVRVEPKLVVSGFSQWNRGRWLLAVNRDDSLVRRRFTLAHELKHILDMGMPIWTERADQMRPSPRRSATTSLPVF